MKRKRPNRRQTLILIIMILISILARIFGEAKENGVGMGNTQQEYFAIVPHFALQPEKLADFYTFLKRTYTVRDKEHLNIVLISPDHFDASDNDIDMLCKDTESFCYQGDCVKAKALPSTKTSGCLNKDTNEHGLGEHFHFIKETFPQAVLYPIVVKPRKFIGDTELIEMLSGYAFVGKTLIIASTDFSHYVDENFAKLHDRKSLYTLNNAKKAASYSAMEVDCPSCLYITNTLAQQNGQYPRLFLRDSSSEIFGKNLGTGNTSRQFIYYASGKEEANGFTVAFFGDLIFDRQVTKILSGEQAIKRQFRPFYQQGNTALSLTSYQHRKLFGIDYVGFNLETPMVDDTSICQRSGKEVNFCSNASILGYLKQLGFTIANVANNHSLDGGIAAHQATIENIKKNGLNYMGYVRNAYFEKNYLWKTSIRGIKVARQGFDFTVTTRKLFTGYCDTLKQNKQEGYVNMVSVHRGREYETTHSAEQESLGRQLIDCGADIIIGHHPHVIQDIGRYQGKPIIYSLGNFLFDMKEPVATRSGGYLLIDYQYPGKIMISTGTINASVYQ